MAITRNGFLLTSIPFIAIGAWVRRTQDISTLAFVSVVWLLVSVECFVLFAFHAWIYPRFFCPLRDIKSPKGWSPWIGYAFQDIGKDKIQGTSLRTWVEELQGVDLIRFADLFQNPHLIPVSPQALADVLTTRCYDFEKPSFFRTGSSIAILGDGILLAEGDVHKKQRKQINPAFSFRHVKNLYPTFWKCSLDLVDFMRASIDKEKQFAVVEPNDWGSRATLDILGEAGLGRSFGAVENPDNRTTSAYRSLFVMPSAIGIAFAVAEEVLPPSLGKILPSERIRRISKNTKVIRDVCADLIRSKQSALEKEGTLQTIDILSVILSQKEVTFTEAEMVEQLVTFLVAGHETTANAVAWSVFVFCNHPEIQTRVRNEVREKLPASAWDKDGPAISPSDLDSCTYLNAFCNEVLRVYPPVPVTGRSAVRDTTIAGHFVPKGTHITLAPWAINISTALWGPDAAEFRPERWLENPSGGCKSNYANLTFIHGPRSCIGSGFAKSEFQCLIAAWAGSFETQFHKPEGWEMPKPDLISGVASRPSQGWKVEVRAV